MMQSIYQNNTSNDQDMIIDGMFFSSFTSSEDSPMVSSDSYFLDTFPNDLFSHDDGLVRISRSDIDDICDWIYSSHSEGGTSPSAPFADEWSPSPSLDSTRMIAEVPLNLPGKDTKLENELTLIHILRAYGEAMKDGSNGSLAKVIVESIKEKSNPQGTLIERVAYYMFNSKDDAYLRQESIKHFAAALNVCYQTLNCGRFAHNAANAAIIEALPDDVEVLHIVDFDIGEGIQWPALLEALSRRKKLVRLTSLKREGKDEQSSPSCWEFAETKRRLHDHARWCGLQLQIEEKCIEDFKSEMMRRRKRKSEAGNDWLVFNCLVALPHMGRRRRRNSVEEFKKVAQEFLGTHAGIMILGDGEGGVKWENHMSFESYFGNLLEHYRALFEALECNLPVYLGEARAAIECLFFGPFMSPDSWFDEWEQMAKGLEFEGGLKGRRVTAESVAEAKVMVGEIEDGYSVGIEGLRENEMVLRWKESVLVRVSTFSSGRCRRV